MDSTIMDSKKSMSERQFISTPIGLDWQEKKDTGSCLALD